MSTNFVKWLQEHGMEESKETSLLLEFLFMDKVFFEESRRIHSLVAPMFAKCREIGDTNTKNKCLLKLGLKVQNILKKSKSKCSQSKDPQKCIRSFDSEINAGVVDLNKLKNSIS